MKKVFPILLIIVLLTACGNKTTPTEAPTTALLLTYTLYIPNSNADGFDTKEISVQEITHENVMDELQKAVVLTENVWINEFLVEDNQLKIDFNIVFADILCTTGSAGEYMIMGSVVNTYLSAYQAESVFITVNGEILETGHVIYDFPITNME